MTQPGEATPEGALQQRGGAGGAPQGDAPEDGRLDVGALERSLRRLRAAIRVHLVVQRVAAILGIVVGAALLLACADYFLRLPGALRWLLWCVGVGFTLVACVRALRPALTMKLPLTDLALRLEQSDLGKREQWGGVLASALDLSRPHAGTRETPLHQELAVASAQRAARVFDASKVGVGALLDNARLRKALTGLVVVGLVIAGIGLVRPVLVRIGSARILAPWANVQWPKRTGVLAADAPKAHAIGAAFSLRSILTHSSRGADATRVIAHYRVTPPGGTAGPEQTVVLTPQNTRASVSAGLGAPPVEGDVFERLIETQSFAAGDSAREDEEGALEYWFETSDDRTDAHRVKLVYPPRVVRALAHVELPAYAASSSDASANDVNMAAANTAGSLVQGDLSLGDGAGQGAPASVGPVLAGSRVTLALEVNKDIAAPAPDADAGGWARALALMVAPALAEQPELSASMHGRTIEFSFRPSESVRVSAALMDAYGVASRDAASYRFDVSMDRPPGAAVVEPAQDESVLASAVVHVAGEGRDDVGLAAVALRMTTARPPAGSVGAAPEALQEPSVIADAALQAAQRTARATSDLDLGTLSLRAGDEVWLTASVTDLLGAWAGASAEGAAGHAGVVSPLRRLRIISESALVEELRGEVNSLRDAAQRLEQEQAGLMEARAQQGGASKDAGAQREQARRQGGISDKLEPVSRALERVSERLERNKLDDDALKGLLKDAKSAAQEAQASARGAGQAMQEESRTAGEQRGRELAEEVAQRQQDASRTLQELADMLGQGQEDWAVRRSLERLLTEQKQLRSQTATAGERTQGQEAGKLPREMQDELERLARKQQELSQRAAQALDQMEQRAKQVQEADSAQARAMQQAASRARQQQLSQKQQQAGQQIRQNQTGQAQQSQKQAEQAIEEALDKMEQVQAQRDEQLRRVLADIAESLRQLVHQQEGELSKLGAAMGRAEAAGSGAGLDKGMIALHTGTLSLLRKMQGETGDEGRDMAHHADAAQQAQASSIVALRAAAPDLPQADEMERVSLQRLHDALTEAEKKQQEADDKADDRTRRELRKSYQEILELQAAVKGDTQAVLAAGALDRRARSALRALAPRQDELRVRMAELRSKTAVLDEARVFDFAHQRFDTSSANAVKHLQEASAENAVRREQGISLAVLQSLVEALKDAQPKGDGLEDEQGDGGGGSGQGGQGQKPEELPPIAELLLLRGMQAEAAARTRELADAHADALELDAIATFQRDLAAQAKALLQKMEQDGATPPAGPLMDEGKAEDGTKKLDSTTKKAGEKPGGAHDAESEGSAKGDAGKQDGGPR